MRRAPECKWSDALAHIDSEGRFCGYASLFGRIDLSGDVVMEGAFATSLQHRAEPVRMLFEHEPNAVIGVWDAVEEDHRGLWVEGHLTQSGNAGRIADAMRRGVLDGLSIGFRTVAADEDRAARVRRLIEIDLWEVSVVASPMLPEARVRAAEPRTASKARVAPEPAVDAGLIARMRRTTAILRETR